MTLRLVGLMSIVLLVSLAAFALLGSHYQKQVMDELAQTVSTVGRETLRTLDTRLRMPAVALPVGRHRLLTAEDCEASGEPRASEERPGEAGKVTVIAHAVKQTADGDLVVLRQMESGGPGPNGGVTRMEDADHEVVETLVMGGGPADQSGAVVGPVRNVFISLSEVRAEVDPGEGDVVLTIPTREGESEGIAEGGLGFTWVATGAAEDDEAPPLREMRLAIPTAEYQALFSSLRGRSLLLFLGVMVLGTALSAGLASRFTRPIRRLDAGIHRLSEGDLDVTVDVSGRDEIGRLGRAFNEMAGSLRVARDRERELTRRERLSALGRLAAGVAHDVRNPLHSIGLTLQNLQDSCRPSEPGRAADFDRSVGVIREEIRRLDRLVTHFLQFARSEKRRREPVDFASLLQETVRLVEREAERRNVVVRLDVARDLPRVAADAESVRSSILNLVLNSFEAMPEGGVVELSARAEGGELVLQVSDDGRGIDEADLARVFDFAFTTREGGHGLGLPMVHQVVVEDHRGRVSLDSRPGEGTRILLAFPLTAPPGVRVDEEGSS